MRQQPLLRSTCTRLWRATDDPQRECVVSFYANRLGVRASDKGFLPMSLKDYLTLLDWTGRQGRLDKRDKVPASLAPILQRIGIESSMWCDLVWNFKKYFGKSAGRPRVSKRKLNEADELGVVGSVVQQFAL